MLNILFIFKGSHQNLTNLKEINLASNDIEYLPDEIGRLTNLIGLNLEYNPIEHLPDSIQYLKKLEVLDIDETLISENEFKRIKKLLPHCHIWF